jgi:hypothetical protein
MKKLFIILVMMMFGSSITFAQTTETGYVTVTWTEPIPCCIPMQYYVCITVMRVSDRLVIVDDSCTLVNYGTSSHQFEFEFPCSYSNEEFQVFASVRAGCAGPPPVLCKNGKNDGESPFSCEELMEGVSISGGI